jgi:hypothetical protein
MSSNEQKSRRKFTPEEDAALADEVERLGDSAWREVADNLPGRTARQCRERWQNYIASPANSDPWTEAEDALLIEKADECGHRWKQISAFLPGRKETDVKNRWHTHLRARPPAGTRRRRTAHAAVETETREPADEQWNAVEDSQILEPWDVDLFDYE